MKSVIATLLRQAANLLGDTLYPCTCIVCGVDSPHSENPVCEVCWGSLIPAPGIETPKLLDRLAVAFAYDERLRKIVLHFKFYHGKHLAPYLARKMNSRLEEIGVIPQKGFIVPVPDHPSRHRERGYNPAGLIAQVLANEWNLAFHPELAVRVEAGIHQSNLPLEERQKALENAFRVYPPPDEHSTMILIDDVIRTGTTISRIAREAKKNGWKRVEAFCLCS